MASLADQLRALAAALDEAPEAAALLQMKREIEVRRCARCGDPFVAIGRLKEYCSLACGGAARSQRMRDRRAGVAS